MNVLAIETFGSFGGGSNKQLSKEEPTFITPDGITFSVWAIIYLFQAIFCIYQVIPRFQNSHAGVSRARLWVIVLYIGGSLWRPVWANRLHWLSLLLILVMDVAVVMIYRLMGISYGTVDPTQSGDMLLPSVMLEEREDTQARLGSATTGSPQLHPWPVKLLCFTGFSTNISWLVVVTLLNLCIAFGSNPWEQSYIATTLASANATVLPKAPPAVNVNGNEDFAIAAVCLCAIIACVLAVRNCDVPYALVTIWALGGAHRAHESSQALGFPVELTSRRIADWCSVMMVVVAVFAVAGLCKAVFESVCAYRSRAPIAKTHNEGGGAGPRFDDIVGEGGGKSNKE